MRYDAPACDTGVSLGGQQAAAATAEDSQPQPVPSAHRIVATSNGSGTSSTALATISERLRQTGLFDDRAVPFSRFTRPALAPAGTGLQCAPASDRLSVGRQTGSGSRPDPATNAAVSLKPSAYFASQATPLVAATSSAAP